MAPLSTQLLTEVGTRNLLGTNGRLACKTDNLTTVYEPIVYKMRDHRRITTLWSSTACYRDNFTFICRSAIDKFFAFIRY
jgi:hypothetical protein